MDLANQDSRELHISHYSNIDIPVNNSGGPPRGDYRSLTRDDWLAALNLCKPVGQYEIVGKNDD